MPKYSTKYFKPKLFDYKTHWAIGLEYPIQGSNGNTYTVTITDNGFTCDCIGMTYHGKCKHTQGVAQRWIDAISDNFEEKYLTKV